MAHRIDPFSLRLLVAAATEGSIARAAVREHIAASALSRRLSDLEHAIGVPLFVRSPHGITLTEAGQLVFERAVRIDNDLQTLVLDARAHGGQVCGTVRLYANASAIVGFLPERLKAFSGDFPAVEIELHERLSSEVMRACLEDQADVGVGAGGDVPGSIDSWHFADDPLLVVLPAQHPLAARGAVRFAEVLGYPLVGLQPGGALDRSLRDHAAAARLPMSVSVSVNSFDAVCRMVEVGLGIAVVPQSAATAYAGSQHFARCALDEPWVQRELRVYALRKTPRPRAVEALVAALHG